MSRSLPTILIIGDEARAGWRDALLGAGFVVYDAPSDTAARDIVDDVDVIVADLQVAPGLLARLGTIADPPWVVAVGAAPAASERASRQLVDAYVASAKTDELVTTVRSLLGHATG